MGLMLAEPGFHTRCFVEWEPYPRSAIIAAQRAGYFAPAPIWDDINTFDGRPFRGAIDTILAGYPCQPFSAAGQRKGADDERHLWPDVARIIREVEPRWVFLENVAGHISLGAETVLRELWDMGWTPAAGAFSAAETGAPHERLRWFCVAYRDCHQSGTNGGKPNAETDRRHNAGRRSGNAMADPDGGNPGAERQQRGGEQRFQPGRDGAVADAGIGRPCGPGKGQDQQPGRTEAVGSGGAVDHTASPRSAGAGSGADQRRDGHERGEPMPRDGRGALADTGSARAAPWGAESHGRQQRVADQPVYDCRPLFPSGPGDSAAWAEILGGNPLVAPALSVGDVKRACDHFAKMVEGGQLEEAAAQSRICLALDGLAERSRSLKLLGNGVVPLAAAHAWRTLASAHSLGAVDLEAAPDRNEARANEYVPGLSGTGSPAPQFP